MKYAIETLQIELFRLKGHRRIVLANEEQLLQNYAVERIDNEIKELEEAMSVLIKFCLQGD